MIQFDEIEQFTVLPIDFRSVDPKVRFSMAVQGDRVLMRIDTKYGPQFLVLTWNAGEALAGFIDLMRVEDADFAKGVELAGAPALEGAWAAYRLLCQLSKWLREASQVAKDVV